MRNYVIINGVNSNTIQGLAINLLPPITKPMMRTQIEEIDGRDGDIITELGYSAYDKEMEIGLWGTYDINQVISFFNGEGTITFSNESDKQYYFKIINQIDYEKLAKFKVATVTFHCQPFKYPTTERQIVTNGSTVNEEGTSITIQNSNEGSPIESILKGDTQQNGTPTPSAPIPVETVTGEQAITVCGKNLLPQDKYIATQAINDITYTNNGDGTFNLVGTASANTTIQIIPIGNIDLTANQPYYLYSSQPYNATTFNLSIAMTNSGTKFILANGTYTPTATPTNVRLQFYIASGKSVNATNVKLMLVKGSTAPTTYEPYQSQSYTINLGSTELCKIGDYQDRIYKEAGKWYIEKQIGKVVLNGTQNITLATSGTRRFNANYTTLGISNIKDGTSNVETANYRINSHFQYNSSNTNWGNYYMYSNWLVLFDDNSVIASANDLKTWFANNLTSIYYVLATPTTTEITDTELVSQLNQLANATTISSATNIISSGNLPSILNISTTKIANTTINNIGNIYAKPLLTIYGVGDIGVYLNGTQVLQIALGNSQKITIDVSKMEAYNSDTDVLMNRLVTGDYMNFLIQSGNNTLTFTGSVTKLTMDNYTRWL